MKKRITAFVLIFAIFFSTKVLAADVPTVQASIAGKIEKGSNIQIIISINDIKSFFAGAMEFKYDTSVLKLKSIEPGDLISNKDINKFEPINKIDEQKGIVSYGFTCLGKVNGYSGSGNFAIINAEVLKTEEFNIRSKPFLKQADEEYNLKLQICDSNIKELEYTFVPYEIKKNSQNGEGDIKNTANPLDNDNNGKSTNNVVVNNSSTSKNDEKSSTTDVNKSNSSEKKAEAADINSNNATPKIKGSENNKTVISDGQGSKKSNGKYYALITLVLGVSILVIICLYIWIKKKRKKVLEKEAI